MKITKTQLRRIVKEATDVINRDTGEIMFFGDKSYVSDIPVTGTDEMIDDIMRRLGISPSPEDVRTYSTGGRDMELSGEDWQRIKDAAGRDSIKEAIGMKITRKQLRRIIKEEQMTFNQSGVDAILAMADQADKMYRTLQNTAGQSNAAFDPLFEELEDILIDLPGKLEELAQKLHRQGVEGGLK